MTHEGGALSPPSVILAEIKIHQAYVLTCRDLLEERSLPAPGRCRIFKHIRNAELFTDTEKSATEVEQAVAILQLATIMCPKPSEAHGTSVAAQRRRTNTVIFSCDTESLTWHTYPHKCKMPVSQQLQDLPFDFKLEHVIRCMQPDVNGVCSEPYFSQS